jgi:hypothetical protein
LYAGKRYELNERIYTPDSCSIVHCNQHSIESDKSNLPPFRLTQMSFMYTECPEDLGGEPELESEDLPEEATTLTDVTATFDERLRIKREANESEAKRSSCYWSYEMGSCCGTSRCRDAASNASQVEPEVTCRFENRTYREGEKIYSDLSENGCSYCLCNSHFDPAQFGRGAACTQIDCLSAVMEERIRSGCTPIYHGNGCCPYDYYCRKLSM